MNRSENLISKRFGRLTVTGSTSKNGHGYSVCKCDCGRETIVRNDGLKSGRIVSCGCYNMERAKRGENRRTHGLHGTRLYRIWQAMINRCRNESSKCYRNYGGRGIAVCEEWGKSFQSFYDWAMSNGYADNLTIDRIDNNGNYEPNNCRWASYSEQSNNKRTNHLLEYNGEIHSITEWSAIVGISRKILNWRVNHGWSTEKALTTPKIETGS